MSLHVEVSGRGAPLVMLHGWGMHGGVWQETAARLAEDFEVHVVDLPGHGKSSTIHFPPQQEVAIAPSPPGGGLGRGLVCLDSIVSELSARFHQPLSVLGWSLGGIVALHWAARAPEQVQRLVLAASTPCFAARSDWNCGMPQETLLQFAAELENNHAATLRRFLGLQLRGSENERELLAVLRERLFSRGEPDMAALRGGLSILRDADLRAVLPQIGQPALLIAGERDKLTPPQASRYMVQSMPDARMVEIKGAAHAPFLSHPGMFAELVRDFLKNN